MLGVVVKYKFDQQRKWADFRDDLFCFQTFVKIPNIKCGREYNVGVRAKGGKKGYGEAVEKRVDAPGENQVSFLWVFLGL